MSGHIPMTAPAATSNYTSKKKNPNLQLVPMGMHPAIIYGVVNIGTHIGEWKGVPNKSNKLKMMVEFPTHRQIFYEEDTEPTPSSLIMDFNYSVSKNNKSGKKSKLLEAIESLYGPLQASQYLSFDIGQMAGLKVFANVIHYTKQDGTIGAKIASLSPFNPAYVDPDTIIATNKQMLYSVQMGFECEAFANLIFFFRKEIKDSEEGKEHIAKGGRFTKIDQETGQMVVDDGNNDYVSAPTLGKIVMKDPSMSYDAMISAGWTDQSMIEHGHATREASAPAPIPTPAPIPQPVAPIAQAIPQAAAPMSISPQMPLASSNPTASLLTMLDKSATYEQFIKAGWTDELLVQHGKALKMAPAADVFPSAPPVSAPPVAAPPVSAPLQPIPQAMAPIAQGIPAPQPTAAALFSGATPAPVQQGIPQAPSAGIPQAPMSAFEQPAPPTSLDGEHDDLPF